MGNLLPECKIFIERSDTSYDLHWWYKCLKWWHLQVPFVIIKNFGFQVVRAKNGKKWLKIPSISLYLRNWFFILICVYTMMISPVIFSFFQNPDFLVFKGLKMQKMIQNYKFQSVMLYIWGTVIMSRVLVYRFKIMISRCFSCFV